MKFAHEMEDGSVSTEVNYQIERTESNDEKIQEDDEMEENNDLKIEVFDVSDDNVETVECKPDFENEETIESPSKSSEKSYDTVVVSADDKIVTDGDEDEIEDEEIVEEDDEEKAELERENIIKKIVVRVSLYIFII